MAQRRATTYAICLNNHGCDDLLRGKIYRILPDPSAEKEKHLRVIDESGEDYLYPAKLFFAIELPQAVKRILNRGAKHPV